MATAALKLQNLPFQSLHFKTFPRYRSSLTYLNLTIQRKSFSTNNNDDNTVDKNDKSDVKKPQKETQKSEASKKLLSLLSSIKVNESFTNEKKIPLKLAKPGGSMKLKSQVMKQKIAQTPRLLDNTKIMEKQLKLAVTEVAESLGGDTKKTESELDLKIKSYSDESKGDSYKTTNISNMFVGMKIDHEKKAPILSSYESNLDHGLTDERSRTSHNIRDRIYESNLKMDRFQKSPYKETDIFGSPPLGFFQKGAIDEPKTIWERLELKELQSLVNQPHINAFEEMIQWTEQGKLWQFPINNEFGLDEEAKVGFEEHVFLEPLLEGFPSKGPIRHFMELVIVGLSKNPYISVERKHENIEWFRQYFAEKEKLLNELGAIDGIVKSSEANMPSS